MGHNPFRARRIFGAAMERSVATPSKACSFAGKGFFSERTCMGELEAKRTAAAWFSV